VIKEGQRLFDSIHWGGYYQVLRFYYDLYRYDSGKLKGSKLGTE